MKKLLLTLLVLVLGASGLIYVLFERDMGAARAAIANGSLVVDTAAGAIEYAEAGTGYPLLSIHGAAGGFDQGLANARSMFGPEFRVVAPSRFGYLRTPVPADVSPAAQADAHVALLDQLQIPKAVVFGTSAGTRSALELALRHPDRVAALVLVVPATYTPDAVPTTVQRQADFPVVLWLVNAGADFAWWALERISPDTLISFVGVPPPIVHSASPADHDEVMAMVRSVEPLSARYAGINIDSRPDLSEPLLQDLRVPTLIVTARDDLFDTLPPAEYAAAHIPGARLVVYDNGGHLLIGHGEAVQSEIATFLAEQDLAAE